VVDDLRLLPRDIGEDLPLLPPELPPPLLLDLPPPLPPPFRRKSFGLETRGTYMKVGWKKV